MEEISQYLILDNELSSLLNKPQSFRCIKGNNIAHMVCSQSKCLLPGFMCRVQGCSCQQVHQKCRPMFLKRIIKSILNKKQQIPQGVHQSYQQIYQKINIMIQDLSNLRYKFELQEEYFGLLKQQAIFIQLIKQNKINQISGKIIDSMRYTLDLNIQFMIASAENIRKDFQNKKQCFSKLCLQIEKRYSKKDNKFKQKIFIDSKIIGQSYQRQKLYQWLSQTTKRSGFSIQTKLLFRASEHQFKRDKFHQICDGIQNTLVIVKNQYDKIIGGFTHEKWNNNFTTHYKDQKGLSFLFSMNLLQKYKCIKPQKSIKNHQNYGPMFGGGGDLYITDSADSNNNSFANFANSFNLLIEQTGNYKYQQNQEAQTLFTGNPENNNFRVKEYQVYQIIGLF